MSDTVDLAVRSLHAAMKRDSASGDGMSIVSITPEAFTPLDEKDIQKRVARMKLT
jgi:proteasome beta subunit